jgi:hypothetical protein
MIMKAFRILFIYIGLNLFSACGLVMNGGKPDPDSAASIMQRQCFTIYYLYDTDSSEKSEVQNIQISERNQANLLMCLVYANTLSDDPLDCSSDDFDRFLQLSQIIPTRGCSGAFTMRE